MRTEQDADPKPEDGGDHFLRTFMSHEPALRAYARVLVPSWHAVDDVMQEASVVMWRKFAELDAMENFLAWARVIVRFEALRARRKFARDRLVFSEELLAVLADEAEEITGEDRLAEAAALRGCLQKLSLAHQELILAPYAGDGRVKQLGERAGRSANSLYKLLGRLRSKLHDCVERELASSRVKGGLFQ
jgi:RNA polymerase sigma-70 factor, ECF subfamily